MHLDVIMLCPIPTSTKALEVTNSGRKASASALLSGLDGGRRAKLCSLACLTIDSYIPCVEIQSIKRGQLFSQTTKQQRRLSMRDCGSAAQHIIHAIFGCQNGLEGSVDRSLYARLEKYVSLPDERLEPAPEINELLSRLVSYLQGQFVNCGATLIARVEREVCDVIDSSERLRFRSDAIRSVAIRAESQMESYWTSKLVQCTSAVDSSLSALEKIRFGSDQFPYTMNYVSMVQTEANVIRSFLKEVRTKIPRKRLNVAFCGSGPLPLTGILLAACMHADVKLIDIDKKAVELSGRLIDNWEKRGIMPEGQVQGVVADGGDLEFVRSGKTGRLDPPSRKQRIVCDVLFLAALIPNATKEEIARTVSRAGADGPLVVLRTAHGLTARLAYFQNRRHIMTKYLEFRGLVSPIVHRLEDGHIVDDVEKPMAFFSEHILNSLEVYGCKAMA